MRAAGRRRPKESFAQERKPPPTPTADPWQFTGGPIGRDSDASLCSSRPSSSSIGIKRPVTATAPATSATERSNQLSVINKYLASRSPSIYLKPPLPPAKDITETLRFVLNRLDFATNKLEEDLLTVLKHLNCPIKLTKSSILHPGTPHSWPSLLAVIHWLVQIAMYNDHLTKMSENRSSFADNSMLEYSLNSYLQYIQGNDDAVEILEREFIEKLDRERASVEETVKMLENTVKELEGKLEGLKSGPSPKELLEKEKGVLEEDVKKFHSMIEQLKGHIMTVEKVLEEKEKELEAKVGENKRICEENEELKKRIESQHVNSRDAERMKRELQAVERDIADADAERNAWDEKCWDLNDTVGRKFKELQALSMECNQAMRRLKLGNGFQYELNPKGSTAAEVQGIDYKSTLKPELATFADDLKKSSMARLEELISLQQQSVENASKIETRRNRITALQSHCDEVEAQLNLLHKEIQDHTSRCSMEARRMVEEVENEVHSLAAFEREASEFLKASKVKLQEAIVQSEEEVQAFAHELFALVDSVSKYKEYMASKISEMKSDLAETSAAVSDFHKSAF